MLQIHFLGSGSGGNAIVIRWGRTCLLLDCGFSGKEIERRLRTLGQDIEGIEAVLLTHEHSDHVKGLAALARKPERAVYCTAPTARAVYFGRRPRCERVEVRAGRPFSVGELQVEPFVLSHDARQPVGYVFHLPDGTRLGIATDLGHPNPEAVEALRGCDLIGLESNHDPDMLRDGPYPWVLKQRIRSDLGHLSNPCAAGALEQIVSDRLRRLFALHLSQTNNEPDLARRALTGRLIEIGLDVPVTVVGQDRPDSFIWSSSQTPATAQARRL